MGGPELVEGTYRRSKMDWDTLREIGISRETLSVFLDGSKDPRGVATNWGIHGEARDGLGNPRAGLGRVGGP